MKKINLVLALSFALSSFFAISAFAGSWQQTGGRWWYQNNDGSFPKSTWQNIDGAWHYFHNDGYMAYNTWIGNYYVSNSGSMLTNANTPDGYKVGVDGAWTGELAYPKAEYLVYMLSRDFMSHYAYTQDNTAGKPAYYGQPLYLDTSKLIDRGDYYELKNTTLYVDTQYYSRPSTNYTYSETVRLSNGGWIRYGDDLDVESTAYYTGSVYIRKDVSILSNISVGNSYVQKGFSMGEYLSRKDYHTMEFVILELDDKGYVKVLKAAEWS